MNASNIARAVAIACLLLPALHSPAAQLSAAPSYYDQIATSSQVLINASSLSDAVAKAAQAAPNTRIVIPSGVYTDVDLSIRGNGQATKPILLEGQPDGSTILTGTVNLTVSGSYVLLRNLYVLNPDSNSYDSSAANIYFDDCSYCGLYNSHFYGSVAPVMDGSGNDAKSFKNIIIAPTSQSVEIGHNTFEGKQNQDSVVLINRSTSRAHLFEGHRIFSNLFTNRVLQGNNANDFDIIRIGDSSTSQSPSPSIAAAAVTGSNPQIVGNTVEFNVFENGSIPAALYSSCLANNNWSNDACKTEPEIISVKAPQSIIRFNTFRNNTGGLTLRHGFQDIVEGNYITGANIPQGIVTPMKESYGMRVIGDHHLIVNNHFENTDSSSSMKAGISVLPGVPNSPLNGYWQVYDAVIAMNFVSKVQTKPVSFASDYGGSSKTVLPQDVVFSYNLISGGSQAMFNQAPSSTYLGTFSFNQNSYDEQTLGIPVTATKVSAVAVSPLGSTGFSQPTSSTYVGSDGLLWTSSSRIGGLGSELTQISTAQDAAILQGLSGFLLMKSGTLYSNFQPLMRNEVGCSFRDPAAPPTMTSPAQGSTLPGSSATFAWSSAAGAQQYWVWIGTTPGGMEIYNRGQGLNTSATVNGLLTNGSPVYVRLFTMLNGAWQWNDYTYTAASPTKAAMISPAPGSTLPSSAVNFNWSVGAGAQQYWVWIGTTPGGMEIYNQGQGLNTSATVNGLLTNGSPVYVRLFTDLNGAWQWNDYTYTAASPTKAAMISPAPGSTLPSSAVNFNWSVGAGAQQYWVWIGTTPGGMEIYNQGQGLNTSATVNVLPTNGSPVHVRLFTDLNGAWQWNDYTYTAAAPTKAAMISPAPGSTLPSASMTFNWSVVAGAQQYWMWVGSAPGGMELYNQGQALNTSAAVNGLPTNGSNVYVRLFTMLNGTWQWNDHTYTSVQQ